MTEDAEALREGLSEGAEALREAACCRSEPECMLCPLRPENLHLSLQQLWELGLYARLPALGFK